MPGNKLLHFLKLTPFTFLKNTCLTLLPHASTVFIDESKNGRASYVVNRKVFFYIDTCYSSTQLVELQAALIVFQLFDSQEFNLFSDSNYVVGALQEMIPIIQPLSSTFSLFYKLQRLIRQHACPFLVGHI